MENWFRRLLSSPALRSGSVKRDKLGRVASADATFSLSDDGIPVAPRPAAGQAEIAALAAAEGWLEDATLTHMRSFALGEERSYAFDQDDGSLRLVHADGAELRLAAQIISSFRPQDRSFRWAWANSGVRQELTGAVVAARDQADASGFESFRTPTFGVAFEDAVRLAALAARLGGCDGVYRCIADNSLTVFVGFRDPGVDRATWFGVPGATPNEAAAIALVDRYDAEMLQVDRRYEQSGGEDNDLAEALLKTKDEIHGRYWRRADDYWKPCSFASPSDHDPARVRRRVSVPRRAGGVYVISLAAGPGAMPKAHVVEAFDDGLRVTDQDLDWGSGLLF